MAAAAAAGGGAGGAAGTGAAGTGTAGAVAAPPRGIRAWLRSAFRFATDRNDFRRNLLVNLGLFAAGVWVARNLTDIDLMAPQPVP
ncbi:mitochondrial import receptor subunit TOM6 homolog [Corvus cornix cornix]|nr:mitochondrial import receptor subunit TOM6 homolog [Corvus cornix cornix]XP_039421052.1 mitochondrial import receptor subunit TOM6 homolog [Corvus cornix cornix]XP_041869705.1 mitochondrial import receptor subunit TOM6 homolog [Corvus kubaryi]XP_041869706.1 mitochondrial import receptor subunit TOM6 homolog [Corvus kubaryi]XP_048183734.1 mitochondrial import receptor subunit TOM6 homolog [Corvus hawaiiensis]XP_048183735.1 mitochondrial import receptor subunit TOM6 homolog [Corvus hawaiiensi